jgi:hypothetical protein
MKRLISILMTTLFAMAVCSGQEPDWVRGTSSKFPDAFYLVGVGAGKTREVAENQARASIAKIFRVDVTAVTGTVTTETITTKDQKSTSDINQKTVADVEVGVRKTLEGTEIADSWEDKENGTMYALAVLKRSTAQSILEEQIQQKDDEIVSLGKGANEATRKLEKLRFMLRRKSLMVAREELDNDYRIVDAAHQGIPAPFSIEKEKSAIDSFLKNEFQIGVGASGDESSRLIQPALKYLSANGLKAQKVTAANQSSMDVLVTFQSELEPSPEPTDEWYYCRWQVDMSATDRMDGSALTTDSKKGNAGQLSERKARKKAITEMTKSVDGLVQTVWNTLSGEE